MLGYLFTSQSSAISIRSDFVNFPNLVSNYRTLVNLLIRQLRHDYAIRKLSENVQG